MNDQMRQTLIVSKVNMLGGLDKAATDYKVAALTKKGDQALYDFVKSSADIEFTCKSTVLSPKKFFFPQDEVILEYTSDGKVSPKIESNPLVLFGIRPCDLNAMKILDEAFADGHGDPNYLEKRNKAVIIGVDCKNICDEDAFCYKVGAHEIEGGCDAMLYDLGERYAVAVITAKGEEFFKKYISSESADESAADIENYKKEKEAVFADKKLFKDLDKFPEIFENNKDHKVWEEEGKKCLSCGSCIMVCPTCYCFDVVDELALSLKKGERIRRWDACMLGSFAEVAGGENFREAAKNRLHHRIDRKFNYLMKKHGKSVCVGCGRCVRACLAKISPEKIAQAIVGEEQGDN
jgi:sulfhydrogenase subunit beta (sulfur reductase)